jgi:hypothetical protein
LFQHIEAEHEDYMQAYKNALEIKKTELCITEEQISSQGKKKKPTLQVTIEHFIPLTAQLYFGWIEWIVIGLYPFSFCEKEINRKYSNLKSAICVDTLMKYMKLICEEVEKTIARILPEKFVLVFDGWSCNFVHYVAIFAVFDSKKILLAFQPLFNEADLGHESHAELIISTLNLYQKDLKNVICLVGDNCAVNKALADFLHLPLIGCASHRFNLAVNLFFEQWEQLIEQVHSIMKSLRTTKNIGRLHEMTELAPRIRQETRWSGTFKLLRRYFEIKDFVDEEVMGVELLTRYQERTLSTLVEHCKHLESISLELQKESCTMLDVRVLFDEACLDFPVLKTYISETAEIIHSNHFESAICKILNGKESDLTILEKDSVKHCLKSNSNNNSDASPSSESPMMTLAQRALKKKKIETEALKNVSAYIDLKIAKPTSNIAEQFFSIAGYTFPQRRQGTHPANIEMQLFLNVNRALWNVYTVNRVIHLKNDQ